MKTTKRLLVSLLALVLVLTMLPFTALAAPTAETLEEKAWTPISSPADFMSIAKNGYYYLTQDIDFTGYNGADGVFVKEYLVANFDGVLDGRGYTVKGFKLATPDSGAECKSGIFRSLGNSDTTIIRNLNIGAPGEEIVAELALANSKTEVNFGFLSAENIGKTRKLIVDNVNVYGNATLATASGKARLGGLVGYCREFSMTNCTFNGSILVNCEGAYEINAGGLIAIIAEPTYTRSAVVSNCTNNGTITVNNATNGNQRAGGVAGYLGGTTLVKNFKNNGNVTSPDYAGGVAGIIGNDITASIIASTNTATVTGSKNTAGNGDVYGWRDSSVQVEKIYVRGCTSQNTPLREFSDLDDAKYATDEGYVWVIRTRADLESIGKTVNEYTYSNTDRYVLGGNIDLSDKTYTGAVVSSRLGGVFDGNGYAVTGLVINDTSGDVGFFDGLSHSNVGQGDDDCMIIDFSIGTPDSYASVTGKPNGSGFGVLSGFAGHTTDNHSVIISGVDIYANAVNNGTGKDKIGGFLGLSRRVSMYDCNFYGSLTSNTTIANGNYVNIGGFIGTADGGADKTVIMNCNNFADITATQMSASGATSTTARACGFVGYFSHQFSFINSNNFGDITLAGDTTTAQAAAFAANAEGTSTCYSMDCSNFGNVSSVGYAAGFVNRTKHPVVINGFYQLGTVSGALAAEIANGNESAATDKLTAYNCVSEKVLDMKDGASVRLSASNAGLRFMAKVSEKAIERLEKIYGENTVSYGILISPELFVNQAADFTPEALDEFAEKNGKFGDAKAYVDVAATKWFEDAKGVQQGWIAGSVSSLEGLYTANFCGRAYIKVTVNGSVVASIYADDVQSRSVETVANGALNDVRYVKDNTYYELVDGVYTVYTKDDASTYVNLVEEANAEGYVAYSCYTDAQLAILRDFASVAQ